MYDLISRQAAIDAVKRLSLGETDAIRLAFRIEDYLERLSSAQPEIIRCKECKYFDKYIDCKEMYQWDGFCADWARKTYEKWYCSRAERRNDG